MQKRKISGFGIFLLALLCANILLIAVKRTAFRLETVYIDGLTEQSAEHVAEKAGLFRGQNLLALQEKTVAAVFENDPRLEFTAMRKVYPDTLELVIRERKPAAALRWLGVNYILDKQGVVLSEESAFSNAGSILPLVTGLRITTLNIGNQLRLRTDEQMEAYQAVMNELEIQNCASLVASLNFNDVENLYLVTDSGISVRLGNADYMRAKIGAVRTDTAYLRQLGKNSGLLDVTTPEDAKYLPED